MTEKVFWANPYQTELRSIVTSIEGNDIELDRTIFYAESGGQESDAGTINGVSVLSATKDGARIIYSLESPPNFVVGDTVLTKIDWERRYALMKLHFAAEVVLEKFYQRYDGVVKVGAHISQEKSRIDFEWPENITGLLKELEIEVQALLDMSSPIISDFSDVESEKRYWQVDGFAQVPCGGTHLKNTSEVGLIKLKRKNLGKGKERVEITLNT
ncbi:alanyl-tRNA editing protein [Vibrio parahaemolyticus]|uniref:alanine--tRNA ligase-related protein n=1 Tax=Vibrio parahaemolyticus TaxID=670 RepID=UPI00112429D7|nr:alanyl-tRNA editing protein [Vibrio parahaemolyticus]MDG2997194.1 alanyl-tRNA editing protein [Vibrio parahaemolyticus]TOK27439.1 alanyl-tRNA editing protein [Vibrio parahaemolyticus]